MDAIIKVIQFYLLIITKIVQKIQVQLVQILLLHINLPLKHLIILKMNANIYMKYHYEKIIMLIKYYLKKIATIVIIQKEEIILMV